MLIVTDPESAKAKGLTPAHVYKFQRDFSDILKEVESGHCPVGTGEPFPVVFEDLNDPINTSSSSQNPFKRNASGWFNNR